MKIQITRRVLLAGAFAVAGSAFSPALGLAPAMAHSAPCPYCSKTVSDDTASVLKVGRKRLEYKCAYCALAEAKTEYPSGDITVSSPSEKKGQPVVAKRIDGKWSLFPATAYYVSPAKLKHKVCQAQSRAFTTKTAATAFAKANGGTVMTLTQMNAMVK